MSHSEAWTCDRCGKKTHCFYEDSWKTLTGEIDLCRECKYAFERFMKDPTPEPSEEDK
jgi:hypothetical protein